MDYKLKNREALLDDIVSGLKFLEIEGWAKLSLIEVQFLQDDVVVRTFPLTHALDCISSDLYFDENGDFSEVSKALVFE